MQIITGEKTDMTSIAPCNFSSGCTIQHTNGCHLTDQSTCGQAKSLSQWASKVCPVLEDVYPGKNFRCDKGHLGIFTQGLGVCYFTIHKNGSTEKACALTEIPEVQDALRNCGQAGLMVSEIKSLSKVIRATIPRMMHLEAKTVEYEHIACEVDAAKKCAIPELRAFLPEGSACSMPDEKEDGKKICALLQMKDVKEALSAKNGSGFRYGKLIQLEAEITKLF